MYSKYKRGLYLQPLIPPYENKCCPPPIPGIVELYPQYSTFISSIIENEIQFDSTITYLSDVLSTILPAPRVLPVGNKYCPPIPGIVPLTTYVYPGYSTFISSINGGQFNSTIILSLGLLSTPTNYVNIVNNYKTLSESGRMQEQQCTTMYISNAPVPVQRGDANNIPYVNIIPTSASGTTQSIQNAVLFAERNPYNPATRFSQYRFANTVIPPPPPCPVAVPNPGYVPPCVPPTMFRGSVENVGPT